MQPKALILLARVQAVVVLFALALVGPAISCPQETVEYPSVTLHRFAGRIVPPEGNQVVPGGSITFVVREKGRRKAAPVRVPVKVTGEFDLALRPGNYEYSLQIDGYLFTLVGEVLVSRRADTAQRLIFQPPWC